VGPPFGVATMEIRELVIYAESVEVGRTIRKHGGVIRVLRLLDVVELGVFEFAYPAECEGVGEQGARW
jgi:hypothetical protein